MIDAELLEVKYMLESTLQETKATLEDLEQRHALTRLEQSQVNSLVVRLDTMLKDTEELLEKMFSKN